VPKAPAPPAPPIESAATDVPALDKEEEEHRAAARAPQTSATSVSG